jgi:CBS domain-containing membrane protein
VDGVGQLVGLVTHRDVMAAKISSLSPLSEDEKASLQEGIPVDRIMRTNVWSVSPETPALAAARLLRDHAFGCLPVVEGRVLVGIVTEADFLALLIDSLDRSLEPQKPPEG